MLSNLPSRINYRTSSDIRQGLRNWVQPTSRVATWKPATNQQNYNRAGQEALATNQRIINRTGRCFATTQRSINWLRERSATNQRRINRPCLNLRNIAVWSRLSTLSKSFPLRFSVQFRDIFLTGSRKVCQLAAQTQPLVEVWLLLVRQFCYILFLLTYSVKYV